MTPAEASKVIGFLAKAKAEGEIMKGHIINCLNALMTSNDPVSVKYCQILSEAINQASVTVLNESAVPAVPAFIPSAPATPAAPEPGKATPKEISQAILDHASRLMV